MLKLKISSKILLSFVLVAIVTLGLVGFFSYSIGVNALEQEAFNKLTVVREMKASQIEEYFQLISDQILTLSQDRMIIDAMNAFEETHEEISNQLELSDEILLEWESRLTDYYLEEFIPRLKPNLAIGTVVNLGDYYPKEPNTKIMQSLFIANNQNQTGSKDKLDNPGDASGYSAAHEIYHPIIRDYLDAFGYYDIFLVDVSSGGHIVYSVFKEVDFGTSLLDGPYADTNFGRVYQAALEADRKEFVILADYEAYQPSYNAPAAFISSPIFNGEEKIGVLIFQMPIDRINNIMTNNMEWEAVGLGVSGETYIVGEDFLLRNQSRFLIEDRENFFRTIEENGTSKPIIDRIRNLNSTIGLQEVRTVGTIAALEGQTGTDIFPDYRGASVFSAYKPLDISGVNWVIMSEKDEAEIFLPIRELQQKLAYGMLGLFAAIVFVGILFSRTLTRPITVLNESALELSKGNLENEVAVTTKDEIGGLAKSFEAMRLSMKDLITDLEDINQNLELKVEVRTKELELATERVRMIVKIAPDAVITIDSNQLVTMFNPRAEEIFGYSAGEVIGQPLTMLMPGKSHSIHLHEVEKFGQEEVSAREMDNRREVFGRRKDGTKFPAEAGIAKMVINGEKYFTTFFRDITERKQAEEQLRFLSEALRSAADGVAIIDKEDEVQWVNPSFTEITGYSEDEIIGNAITILNSGEHTDEFYKQIGETVFSGEVWRGEIIQKRKDGSLYPEALSMTPIFDNDGEIENFVSIRQDITERKELERQLEQANERMSEELNFAQEIQMSMLPLIFPAFPTRSEFNIYAHLIPAREVGGDFYDFYFLDEDYLCFVIGDVSGKGAPGALLMAVSKTLIKSRAMDDFQPSSILTHVNNELSQNNDSAMFVTVFLGVLEINSGRLVYCNAGHNPPYIHRSSGEIEKLDDFHGPVIGALPNLTYKESSVTLRTNDIITLHTDGVTEAMNQDEIPYSDQRYEKFLQTDGLNTPQKLIDQVIRDVKLYEEGAEQADDITMVSLQYHGSSELQETGRLELKVKNQIEELAKVEEQFEEFCKQNQIPDPARQKVSIVLDELLNNVVNYAFRDEEEHIIELNFVLTGNRLVISIYDDGVPFNPFELDPPNISLSLDERAIGGLGIFMVRQMMDEYLYSRHIGKNVVRLVKLTDKE